MLKAIKAFFQPFFKNALTPHFRYVSVEHNFGEPKLALILQIGYDLHSIGTIRWRLATPEDVERHKASHDKLFSQLESNIDKQFTALSGKLRTVRHEIKSNINESVNYYIVLEANVQGTDRWREATCFDFKHPNDFTGIYNTVF